MLPRFDQGGAYTSSRQTHSLRMMGQLYMSALAAESGDVLKSRDDTHACTPEIPIVLPQVACLCEISPARASDVRSHAPASRLQHMWIMCTLQKLQWAIGLPPVYSLRCMNCCRRSQSGDLIASRFRT